MADRTLAEVTEVNKRGWIFTLRVERLSSGQPGAIFVIDVTDPDGRFESSSVVVSDAWEIVVPLTYWLEA